MTIENVSIYLPQEIRSFAVGNLTAAGVKLTEIKVRKDTVTILFQDGYRLVYKGSPYSIEAKR